MTSSPRRPLRLVAAAGLLLAGGCNDEDDGGFRGPGDVRLLVATRGPDAVSLFDARTLDPALDTPTSLPAPPLEARAGAERAVFVVSFEEQDARAFDSRLFEEVPSGELEDGGRVAFDAGNGRIWLAGTRLRGFDANNFSPLGFPPVDLGGQASDVVHDPGTGRLFVAVTTGAGPVLRVFDAANLAEVPPSPLDLPGTGPAADLLLVEERNQVFAALPGAERLAGFDTALLREIPRTPVELGIPAGSLARDPEIERIYTGSADGRLVAVSATDFSLRNGFPREVGGSLADLAFDEATEQLFVADSAAGRVRALDALTLDEVADSPIEVAGAPVSVEVVDLRSR